MKKTNVTRTYNRLPFTDLEPRRFEDLTLGLLYSAHKWADLEHIGRTGDDGGIDIRGKEILENGEIRDWAVQCKRLTAASAAKLKKAVNDALVKETTTPKVLLLVIGCDITRAAREEYQAHATSRGISTPLIWSASEIEAKLFAERADLLFTYFGISTVGRSRSKETTIKRNIALKKRMQKDFRVDPKTWKESQPPQGQNRFQYGKLIIHSVDDESYPGADKSESQISGWFSVEFYDFYHNGIEVLLQTINAVVNEDESWALVEAMDQYNDPKYTVRTILLNARIPFRNIVEYDLDGDEYYNSPHLFVEFAEAGSPYERKVYRLIGKHGFDPELDTAKQYKLPPSPHSSAA